MEKRLIPLEERIANLEKLVLFVILLGSIYLHITSENFEKMLSYIPSENAQVFYIYAVLFTFLISVTFSMFYLTLVLLSAGEELSFTFRNYVIKIYEKTKPMWPYSWLLFSLIAILITRYGLGFEWGDITGTIILTVVGAIVFKYGSNLKK